MKTATIGPAKRRIKVTAVDQRTADEYRDEIGIPTLNVPPGSRPPRYRSARTSPVVVVIWIWMRTSVPRERAKVSLRLYFFLRALLDRAAD